MNIRKPDIFKAFEQAFDWFLVGGAILFLIALSFAYFGLPPLEIVSDEIREFVQSIISNLIPTILVFVLAYVLLYHRIQRLRSEQEAERLAGKIAEIVAAEVRRIGESTKLIERSSHLSIPLADLDWLYVAADVLHVEAQIRPEVEVWIVSPDLLSDTGTKYEAKSGGISTIRTVQENLRKKVRYTFVVPDTVQIRMLLPQLRKNYGLSPTVARVVLLPPEIFESLAVSEVAIFDPELKYDLTPRVFMQLPVAVAHTFWALLDDNTAAALVARVRDVIEKQGGRVGPPAKPTSATKGEDR